MSSGTYLVTKLRSQVRFFPRGASALGRLDIELTERCNSNCVHCCINRPAHDAQAMAAEMTTVEIKRILVEAVALGCLQVRFTGGEPLLRDDFKELYVFARKLGLKVMIFTNAMLITESLAELWSKIPPLALMEVSVYGMTQASCEKVTRTPGSFEAAQRGIGLLLRYKIPFVVKGIMGFWDASEIKAFEGWAATIPWMEYPIRYSMFFDLSGRRDEARNARIRQLRVPPEEGVQWVERVGETDRRQMKQFASKFMRPPGEKLFPCGAGCGGCVDAYGKFQPCLTVRHPSCVVDVKRGTLKAALEGLFSELRQWRAKDPEYLKRCAKCFLKGLCVQCPAKSWAEHGTLDTPVEYFCQVAHAQAARLGLLQAPERAWEVKDWEARIDAFVKS